MHSTLHLPALPKASSLSARDSEPANTRGKSLHEKRATKGFLGGSGGKESACSAGDPGWIPGAGRFPREGNDYPLKYSCLENSMDYVACQAPLSVKFSRQEYWSGLPFPFPGNLSNPGITPESPALAGRFFISEPSGKPVIGMCFNGAFTGFFGYIEKASQHTTITLQVNPTRDAQPVPSCNNFC